MPPAVLVGPNAEAFRQTRLLRLPTANCRPGEGAPAPQQSQACGPSPGRSGWFSQTQPRSSQTEALHRCSPDERRPYFCFRGPHRPLIEAASMHGVLH